MKKVCFDKNDNIIGFDLQNADNFINLFDINGVNKIMKEYDEVQVKDSLGRKLYKVGNDSLYVITDDIDNVKEDVTVKEFTTLVPTNVEYSLTINPDKFSIGDIIEEKNKQLINYFGCTNCIGNELVENDNQIKFNCDSGKNVIKVYPNQDIFSNQIKLSGETQIAIYSESDEELQIEISANKKDWTKVDNCNFIDFNKKILYIKCSSNVENNIYCISILIK